MERDIDTWLATHQAEFVEIRRDLHAHPELGFEETRTAALVADTLRGWGIEVCEGIGKTGVVGVIRGQRPGTRAIGLRADMDALSIHEATGAAYASINAGKMHACGHDGHTAMLLGAARFLAKHRDFAGQVNLVFQPSEENVEGALAMIDDGLFERFPCNAIYGLHTTAGMAAGHFATRPGPMAAAGDFWHVIFRGPGGHGGLSPHLSADVTHAQAHFVLGLQGIVGRNVPPTEVAVISVGHIGGGSAASPNVIPAELVLAGTARTYSDEVRDTVEQRIVKLAHTIAAAWGCTAEAAYTRGSCALINQPAQVDIAIAAAQAVAGPANVTDWAATTGSEDFAELSRRCPGAFMRIGNGSAADGTFHAPHTRLFDFNDAIIPAGIRYWVGIVERELAI